MFRALVAHPQEMLHKMYLAYCLRIMSVGCATVVVKLQPCNIQVYFMTSYCAVEQNQ
jgi:hypothetical protein